MNNILDFLYRQWQLLWRDDDYAALFDTLTAHYQACHRHYHNLVHLYECFVCFDKIKVQLQNPKVVALALFYHDVIYGPKCQHNEVNSAKFAQVALKEKVSSDTLTKISAYIIATQQHNNPLGDSDLDYLLDIDLAILGADSPRFNEYNAQIRQEYAWVSDDVYYAKRRQVLSEFYQRSRLFITAEFYALLETQAKHNLKQALGG